MNLEPVTHLIDRELDGEATPEESRRLREFLGRNPDWNRYFESMRRLETAARSAPLIHPSPGFADRILARIEEESSTARAEGRRGGASETREGNETREANGWGSRLSWIGGAAAAVAGLLIVSPWSSSAPAESIGETASEAMRIVESFGVGVADFLAEPGGVFEWVFSMEPAVSWAPALSAFVVVLAINFICARKMPHA